jgi:hypothetical protein
LQRKHRYAAFGVMHVRLIFVVTRIQSVSELR